MILKVLHWNNQINWTKAEKQITFSLNVSILFNVAFQYCHMERLIQCYAPQPLGNSHLPDHSASLFLLWIAPFTYATYFGTCQNISYVIFNSFVSFHAGRYKRNYQGNTVLVTHKSQFSQTRNIRWPLTNMGVSGADPLNSRKYT